MALRLDNRFQKCSGLLVLTILPLLAVGQVVEFNDVAPAYGINYSYPNSTDYGIGVSLYDFNEDGLDDISFGGTMSETPSFYVNTGAGFQQVTMTGVAMTGVVKKCLLWVDYDNDGDLDLSSNNKNANLTLFNNNGTGQFSDVTVNSGLQAGPIFSYAGAWADLNLDGLLDLYSGNRDLFSSNGSPNRLFRNLGAGTFFDVTDTTESADAQGLTYGLVITDHDKDGWPDIYIANDKFQSHNTLLRNLGDGTFTDVSEPASTGMYIDGMGIAAGDIDGDGFEDLYVTNTPQSSFDFGGNILLRNNGDGTFDEIGDSLGVRVFRTGWGCSFADFDNDMDLDLFVANAGMAGTSHASNSLFINQGDGTFVEDTLSAITQTSRMSYGSAVGDINDDGYPDVLVMNDGGDNLSLWQNQGGSNNWLKITLEGVASNRMGIGSWIEVYTGSVVQHQYTRLGTSYGSQDGRATMFGLGQALIADSVIVKWPSGLMDRYYDLDVNQTVHLIETALITDVVDHLQSATKLSIGPNPTNGPVRVSGELNKAEISIMDLAGKHIHSFPLSRISESTIDLDISHLRSGIYLILINRPEHGRTIRKLLVN